MFVGATGGEAGQNFTLGTFSNSQPNPKHLLTQK